jgi:hypothetical protein
MINYLEFTSLGSIISDDLIFLLFRKTTFAEDERCRRHLSLELQDLQTWIRFGGTMNSVFAEDYELEVYTTK